MKPQLILGVSEAEKNIAPIKGVWGKTEADIGINRRDEHGILDRRVGVLKIVDSDMDVFVGFPMKSCVSLLLM
ncbi:MAG: hypothetical protein RR891_08335 [Clostridium sp.]